jgi:hypothetical protein
MSSIKSWVRKWDDVLAIKDQVLYALSLVEQAHEAGKAVHNRASHTFK